MTISLSNSNIAQSFPHATTTRKQNQEIVVAHFCSAILFASFLGCFPAFIRASTYVPKLNEDWRRLWSCQSMPYRRQFWYISVSLCQYFFTKYYITHAFERNIKIGTRVESTLAQVEIKNVLDSAGGAVCTPTRSEKQKRRTKTFQSIFISKICQLPIVVHRCYLFVRCYKCVHDAWCMKCMCVARCIVSTEPKRIHIRDEKSIFFSIKYSYLSLLTVCLSVFEWATVPVDSCHPHVDLICLGQARTDANCHLNVYK